MKPRYRVFRRGWGTYYCEDLLTKKQETLKTRDKNEAFRLVAAKNETEEAPAFSLHLARVYWKAGDPAAATRAWQFVMDEMGKLKKGATHERWLRAVKDKAFDSIRNLPIIETRPEHLLRVLEEGKAGRNEVIAVRSQKLVELKKKSLALDSEEIDWLGFDFVSLGHWSLLAGGMFTSPSYFLRWEEYLNEHGLMSNESILREFARDYSAAAKKNGVEPIPEEIYGLEAIEIGRIRGVPQKR
jgi:hypothetical protein